MKSPFFGGFYQSSAKNLADQQCINLYPELSEVPDSKEVGALLGTPGKTLKLSFTDSNVRAAKRMGKSLYVVAGQSVYRINLLFQVILIGALGTSSGPVQIVNSDTQMLFVDGFQAYGYDADAQVFNIVSSPLTSPPTSCAYQDQFFLINAADTNEWAQSDVNDVFTFEGLNFSSTGAQPGPIVAMTDIHREVWLLGSGYTEIWVNVGTAGFAFQRLQGVFIEQGCVAPASVAIFKDSIVFLGSSDRGAGTVWMSVGYDVVPISTHALEALWDTYPTVADAIAFTYEHNLHFFYQITFPSGNATFVYDLRTKLWHQRSHFANGVHNRDLANCHAYFQGMHLVGDYQAGNLYMLDDSNYTDNGDPIKWVRTWQALPRELNNFKKKRFHRLYLYIQPAPGATLGQGVDPVGILRCSNDGGNSFGNEHFSEMGKQGQYRHRLMWQRLGQSRDRVFEFSGTDPVNRAFIGAELVVSE